MANRELEARLLGILFESRGEWVDLNGIGKRLAVEQQQIERLLGPYREAGYSIEFHPHGRVRLHAPPDIWCAEEILGRCEPGPEGRTWNPLLLNETASTNDVARDQAARGTRAGFVVAAARQTRGRGRLGRAWESPLETGLYASLLLRPSLKAREAGQLMILSSVAMADAVEAVAGFRPQIKWPNDLVVGGRKLGGLLIETEPSGGNIQWAVIGIGINVNHVPDDFSPEIRPLATSLRIQGGQTHRRADLLVALLNAFTRRLARPFHESREAWAASSLTLGQRVTLTTQRGMIIGQAVGLDPSGALLLRLDSGEVELITAGDMQAC